jgi:hypothetical protein
MPVEKPKPAPIAEEEDGIDYFKLAQSMGMEKSPEELGYDQKLFDTCKAGLDDENCHKEYLVQIHFRLMCRKVEATDAPIAAADIHPIANRSIAWTLDKKKGVIQTDSQGYGQIRASFVKKPNTHRLKLTTNQRFLFMQADEITRVVSPPVWCQ